MSELVVNPTKKPTINLAIGPNCPVRCEGCYNHFGNTATEGGLITSDEIVNFAATAAEEGVEQATVSGGDPLFHPEIVSTLAGLKGLGMKVKLDTVGTPLIGPTRIAFKGRGTVPQIDIEDISPHIDNVNIPLDGASQEIISRFRHGRSDLFAETRLVASILRDAGVAFGFNTVVNKANISTLDQIQDIAEEEGAVEWQLFEFDESGPNPSRLKGGLKLDPGEFADATRDIESSSERLVVVKKSLNARKGAYFLVDDSGIAWKPSDMGLRRVLGHITRDREQVLNGLRKHISEVMQS